MSTTSRTLVARSEWTGSYRNTLLMSASLLCGLASHEAWAQALATGVSAPSAALETVVVTAQRRAQDIEKTAVAVTAISGRTLARQVILSPSDLNGLAPGAVFIGDNHGLQVAIRGIANNAIAGGIANDLSVSMFVDDMIEARGSGGGGVLFDVDNVQVLRGPQGTLFGRNNTAGALVINNARPTDHRTVSGSLEAGNYGLVASEGTVNLPVTDMIDARASFRTINHSGYLKDGYDDEDDQAGRLRVLFKPTPDINFLLSGDFLNQNGKGITSTYLEDQPLPPGVVYQPFSGQALCPANVFPGPRPGSCIGSNSKTDDRSDGVVGELNWNLDWANLTNILGYREYVNHDDRFEGSGATNQYETGDDGWWSEEMRLANPEGSAIKWIGGLYYYSEEASSFLSNYPQANAAGNYSINDTPKSNSTSYAAFAQTTYPITQRLRLTFGVRHTQDHKSAVDESAYHSTNLVFSPPPGTELYSPVFSKDYTNFKVGLEGDLTPNSLLYADVSTGYKSGGFFAAYQNNTFAPEEITAYEVGIKNKLFDNRMQLNFDGFYYDYKDYQVQTLIVSQFENPATCGCGPGLGLVTLDAPKARFEGGEFDGRYLITPNDRVDASISLLSAKFLKFTIPGPPRPPFFGGNYANTIPPFAPSLTAQGSYTHTWNFASGAEVDFGVQEQYTNSYWIQVQHLAGSHQPGYNKTSIDLTYTSPSGRWSLGGWARNLENRSVINSYLLAVGPGSYASANVDPPRTYGVRFSFNL